MSGQSTRSVLVVGASSGIGRATAHLLAARGYRVALVSRSREVLDMVAQECVARGADDVLVLPADIRDHAAVDATVEVVRQSWGVLDGAVHSAAVLAYGRFEDVPRHVFDAAIASNVTGTANVARCVLSVFNDQGHGRLVVVGSVLGKIATPLMTPYITSKWAEHGLVRTLQIEARSQPHVHISLVSPGGVNTPVYSQAGSYTGHPGAPPPPVDPPEKVAHAVVGALERPRREVSVGFANPLMVMGFRMVPAVFDLLVTPLMRLAGQERTEVPPHPGNVLDARPEGEAVRGHWPRRFLR